MLHILLILLKIIGIILLASLALVALLFILPASYKIEGIKNKEQSYLRIHGGWLFHLLHFNMEYSEELKYSLRIFGLKILVMILMKMNMILMKHLKMTKNMKNVAVQKIMIKI